MENQGLIRIDEAFWESGIEVMHPGGLEKSLELAVCCEMTRSKEMLDVGCGKGATLLYLAEEQEWKGVGVDNSKRAVNYANKQAKAKSQSDMVKFVRAEAYNLPFKDNRFDVVVSEATAGFLDRARAYQEFLRVLKSGGNLGTLDIIWKQTPPEKLAAWFRENWGFEALSLEQWRGFYESLGLKDIAEVDFSDDIPSIREDFGRHLGTFQVINLLANPSKTRLKNTLLAYERVFNENQKYIGYGYIVGRKD